MKTYSRDDWKDIPLEVITHLESAKDFIYSGHHLDPNHEEIAKLLKDEKCNPFSVIVLTEPLDDSHWEDERYVEMWEQDICSELDETLNRMLWDRHNDFVEEVNQYMKENKMDENQNNRDIAIEALMQKYLPKALEHLQLEYEEIHGDDWREHFDEEKIRQPRTETRTRRKCELIKPFHGSESFQQYYVIPEEERFVRGSPAGSGTRENHSRYGFAFALFNRETQKIPTYVLVLDKDNKSKLVANLDELCLVYHDLGGNYHQVDRWSEMEPLLQDTLLLTKYSNENYDIETIALRTFKELNPDA